MAFVDALEDYARTHLKAELSALTLKETHSSCGPPSLRVLAFLRCMAKLAMTCKGLSGQDMNAMVAKARDAFAARAAEALMACKTIKEFRKFDVAFCFVCYCSIHFPCPRIRFSSSVLATNFPLLGSKSWKSVTPPHAVLPPQ